MIVCTSRSKMMKKILFGRLSSFFDGPNTTVGVRVCVVSMYVRVLRYQCNHIHTCE